MAAQEYYTGTPPNTHLPSAFARPPPQSSQSQPFLDPNAIPPRRGSSNPPSVAYLSPRPQRGSFGSSGSQPPPTSRLQYSYPPPPSQQQFTNPNINIYQPPNMQQPQFPPPPGYNPNIPPSQLPQPYPNHSIPSTHRPPPRRRDSSPFTSSSSDSESYHSDPEHCRRRHHHPRSRSRGVTGSPKSPQSRHRTSRHNSDAWIGSVGGGLIGDIIFPGLGTVGGAVVGAMQGHHYDKKRESKEDQKEMIREERRRRRESGSGSWSRGRDRY